jgi:acetyl-CoA synthetase
LVVLHDDAVPSDALQAELHQCVHTHLGKAFRPQAIWFVERVPKTRSGKIVRRAIRAVLAGETPGDVSTLEDAEALEEIRALAARVDGGPGR